MNSCCIVVLALVVSASGDYSSKHEDLDVAAIVNDMKKLKFFIDCFNGVGECDELTAEFKEEMGGAIKEACSKCSPAHKYNAQKFFEAAQKLLPAEFEVYKKKYDPDNKYFPALFKAVGVTGY